MDKTTPITLTLMQEDDFNIGIYVLRAECTLKESKRVIETSRETRAQVSERVSERVRE